MTKQGENYSRKDCIFGNIHAYEGLVLNHVTHETDDALNKMILSIH